MDVNIGDRLLDDGASILHDNCGCKFLSGTIVCVRTCQEQLLAHSESGFPARTADDGVPDFRLLVLHSALVRVRPAREWSDQKHRPRDRDVRIGASKRRRQLEPIPRVLVLALHNSRDPHHNQYSSVTRNEQRLLSLEPQSPLCESVHHNLHDRPSHFWGRGFQNLFADYCTDCLAHWDSIHPQCDRWNYDGVGYWGFCNQVNQGKETDVLQKTRKLPQGKFTDQLN